MRQATTTLDRVASGVIWILAGGFLVISLSFFLLLYQLVNPDRVQFLERLYCRL